MNGNMFADPNLIGTLPQRVSPGQVAYASRLMHLFSRPPNVHRDGWSAVCIMVLAFTVFLTQPSMP
jgi:hypothetical protein